MYQCKQIEVENVVHDYQVGLGINNYPSELRFSIIPHIIKITVCYGRAELGLSIKLNFSLTHLSVKVDCLAWDD